MKIILLLGPYRNLSTLISSHINFHEKIIVFNHGYERLLENKCDFWNICTDEYFNNFINFVKTNYLNGSRGHYGGNIIHSHAFDEINILSKYKQNIPDKNNYEYILIKDSGQISYDLHNNNFNNLLKIETLLSNFKDKIFFIRPIRNIYKSALSNTKSGHWRIYKCGNDLENIIKWNINELNWINTCKNKYPKFFLYIFENNIKNINNLFCKFLDLEVSNNLINEVVLTDNKIINDEQNNHLNKILKQLLNNNELDEELYQDLLKNNI
jgi:hypothetical protein